jgi:hypothetical protein
VRALNPSQKKTQQSAGGLLLGASTVYIMVFLVGIDGVGDWLTLGGAVVCVIGNVYYIREDIKQATRQGRDDA